MLKRNSRERNTMLELRPITTTVATLIAIFTIGITFPGNVFLNVENMPLFLLAIASSMISAFILFEIKNSLLFSLLTTLLSVALYFLLIGCANLFINGENPLEYLIIVPFAIIIFWKELLFSALIMSSLEFLLGKFYGERSSRSS